jgi:hypothetical protein
VGFFVFTGDPNGRKKVIESGFNGATEEEHSASCEDRGSFEVYRQGCASMKDKANKDVDQANSSTQETLADALKNRAKYGEASDVLWDVKTNRLKVIYSESAT